VTSTDRKNKSLVVLKDGEYEMLPLDTAFPMLHGKYGEDGTVQGILGMADFCMWEFAKPARSGSPLA
jgi:D-alanine-D-alanine ligase-like ATP-grasp enzyme